jgi:hypothetical protein
MLQPRRMKATLRLDLLKDREPKACEDTRGKSTGLSKEPYGILAEFHSPARATVIRVTLLLHPGDDPRWFFKTNSNFSWFFVITSWFFKMTSWFFRMKSNFSCFLRMSA